MNGAIKEDAEKCCPTQPGRKYGSCNFFRPYRKRGNDELGKVLIKGFIFAGDTVDTLPKTMLFYNGGTTLAAEDLTV